MTDEQTQALVKECGLDWQRGFMPLFDGDPTNRYAVLVEAAAAPLLERIAALEAKLAQRVPEWRGLAEGERDQIVTDICEYGTGFVTPLYAIVEGIERKLMERNAAPAAPEQQEPKRQYYFKVNGCTANDCYETECICWHDEGTGPENGTAPNYLKWRAKPVAQAPNAPNAQQAEPALKPMTAHRAAYFMQRFRNEEKLLGPNEQAALKFTIEALEAMETQQAEAQEPCAWAVYWGDGYVRKHSVHFEFETAKQAKSEVNSFPTEIRPLFTRPQPAQLQTMTIRECAEATSRFAHVWSDDMLGIAEAIQSALAAKNGAVLK